MVRSGREILDSLFSRAIISNFITSVFEQGRIGILFSVLAAEMEVWEQVLEMYYNQFTLITATEEDAIVNIAAPLYPRHQATPSKVMLKFMKTETEVIEDILIPQGTLVETSGANPIVYQTSQEVWLYEGQDWTTVLAYSVDYGSNTHVWANELTVLASLVDGVTVTNLQESWSGTDLELIEDVRVRALNVRPELEHGTEITIQNALKDYGLLEYEYNISEFYYNNGSFGIWIDTELDEELEEIDTLLKREKAHGIYCVCQKATKAYLPFAIQVNLALDHDILPQQRDRLKADVTQQIARYIEQNGVGKNLVLNKASHFIIQNLIDRYDIYDLDITSTNLSERQDEFGNIEIEEFEVIKPESITVSVKVS